LRHLLSLAIVALATFGIVTDATAAEKSEKKKPASVIRVLDATYGGNCPGVARGNVTQFVASSCKDSDLCNYRVYYKDMGGDPAEGCAKDFRVTYSCGRGAKTETCVLPAEAGMGGEEGQPNQFCLMHCLTTQNRSASRAPAPRHAMSPASAQSRSAGDPGAPRQSMSPASPQWQPVPTTDGRGGSIPPY